MFPTLGLSGAGALEFVTSFFPHLEELIINHTNTYGTFMTSRLLHLYNSLVRRGVRVDALYSLVSGEGLYNFSLAPDSSRSLDHLRSYNSRNFYFRKNGQMEVLM